MAAWRIEGERGPEFPTALRAGAVPALRSDVEGTVRPPARRSVPGAGPGQPDRLGDRRADRAASSSSRGATVVRAKPEARRAGRLSAEWATRLNVAVDLALVGTLVLANGPGAFPAGGGLQALVVLGALVGVWVITAAVLGYYDASSPAREPLDDAILASTMVLAMLSVAALFEAWAPQWASLRRMLPLWWPALIVVRVVFFRPPSRWKKAVDRVLIVGAGTLGRITGEDLARRGRQRVLGYLVLPDELRSFVLSPPLLGTWMDLESVLRTTPVSEVYIAADASKDAAQMQHAISVCENLGVPFALPAYTFRLQRARPVLSKPLADGYLHYAPLETKARQRALKRICDLLVASLALWLLGPLLAIVALLIKASSRGPVFFKQVRCGLHGHPFEMLKFRSMVADAEQRRKTLETLNERNGPVFKLRKDPRVTAVGAILRKFSIDELPQLINVLRGEMSLVGPRPPIPEEVTKYEAWQLRRLSVRPGLTCIWQISANRHRMSFDEWMYLDLQYIDHWNLLKDAEILFRTIPVVVSGSGEPAKGMPARYNLDVSVR